MAVEMFNYNKLKGRIREMCGTNTEFAQQLGWSLNTLSAKLNHKNDFTQSDIIKSIRILNINVDEVPAYFFSQ